MISMGKTSILMVFFLILGYDVMKISSASSSSPDIDKDKQECTTQLVGLATCLAYVGGTAKAPTPDCCTGLKQVIGKSMKCLCVLVKDRDDPTLGLKINATLALGLPSACKAPTNISECPALLHLAPNSPDAKVFEQFAKGIITPSAPASSGNAKTSPSGGSSAQEKNEAGGKRMVVLGMEMVGGVFLWCFTSFFINGVFV